MFARRHYSENFSASTVYVQLSRCVFFRAVIQLWLLTNQTIPNRLFRRSFFHTSSLRQTFVKLCSGFSFFFMLSDVLVATLACTLIIYWFFLVKNARLCKRCARCVVIPLQKCFFHNIYSIRYTHHSVFAARSRSTGRRHPVLPGFQIWLPKA